MVITLAMTFTAHADFLAVDKPTDIIPTTTQVEVDGVVTNGICVFGSDALGDYVKVLDVISFTPKSYTFKVRWHDGSGWWSDWSVPLVAGKPGTIGNARIVGE